MTRLEAGVLSGSQGLRQLNRCLSVANYCGCCVDRTLLAKELPVQKNCPDTWLEDAVHQGHGLSPSLSLSSANSAHEVVKLEQDDPREADRDRWQRAEGGGHVAVVRIPLGPDGGDLLDPELHRALPNLHVSSPPPGSWP